MHEKRVLGLDLLRMLATYTIVILHVLAFSGLLASSPPLSPRYGTLWFLEAACYGAVNCYALISGYVSLDSRWKPARLVELWLQVVFYTAGATLVLALARPGAVGAGGWLQALTPILSKQYWYFSSYFVLFLLIPFLNKLVNALDLSRLYQLSLSLVLCFSILPLFTTGDIFAVSSGYSPLWLMTLYLLGACMRRTDLRVRRHCLLWYLLSVTAAWAFKLFFDHWRLAGIRPIPHFNDALVLSYLSPLVLAGSLALVSLFSKLRLPAWAVRPVSLLSPVTFGVYIIHTNPVVWKQVLYPRLQFLLGIPLPAVFFLVLLAAAGIYLACTALDLLRQRLFAMCRVRRFSDAVEGAVRGLWRRIICPPGKV